MNSMQIGTLHMKLSEIHPCVTITIIRNFTLTPQKHKVLKTAFQSKRFEEGYVILLPASMMDSKNTK